ncbi:MAG: ABC transporter ATP-binding protein [Candidatus Methanogaster sp.]|uniref:ABC transporter ATP-binding protein n=1 Tax=Candidatus Methanogaster sp. TaxID=3386292 RepID=A0AC61L6H1_9EURY|nr:MAG: ABC transporter ATP-binding protein [ANME-2 cluster archaeon]
MGAKVNILEVRDLVTGYTDLNILHGISIHIKSGEIVSIIGPNGSGKSTLMKAIFGLLRPRGGAIVFKDHDITGVKPDAVVRLGMSYVPQEKEFFPSLTILENLEMGAFIRDDDISDSLERIYAIFPALKEKGHIRAGALSGGEQRMVGIGRALMLSPDLLLLDEPSAGLAPVMRDMVFEKITEVNRAGTSILIVEQNARRSLGISDRGYVLETGVNRFEGRGLELLENEDVLRLYLGG